MPGQEITAPAVDFLIDLLRAEPEAEVHGLQRQAAGVAVRVHRNEEAVLRAPSAGHRQAF